MSSTRALRLRREVLTDLTDSMLEAVAGGDASVSLPWTWCVLCLTFWSCLPPCGGDTVDYPTLRCTEAR